MLNNLVNDSVRYTCLDFFGRAVRWNKSNYSLRPLLHYKVQGFGLSNRQGDVESSMKYLEMFVELADRAQQLPEQQKACTCLGAIYNSLVRKEKKKQHPVLIFNWAKLI